MGRAGGDHPAARAGAAHRHDVSLRLVQQLHGDAHAPDAASCAAWGGMAATDSERRGATSLQDRLRASRGLQGLVPAAIAMMGQTLAGRPGRVQLGEGWSGVWVAYSRYKPWVSLMLLRPLSAADALHQVCRLERRERCRALCRCTRLCWAEARRIDNPVATATPNTAALLPQPRPGPCVLPAERCCSPVAVDGQWRGDERRRGSERRPGRRRDDRQRL